MKIVIGRELSKEKWLDAAENISKVAPMIANILKQGNFEGQGKQDAEDFINDMILANTALCYVAEFATDKCRFIDL